MQFTISIKKHQLLFLVFVSQISFLTAQSPDSLARRQLEIVDSLDNYWPGESMEQAFSILKNIRNDSSYHLLACDTKGFLYHKLMIFYYYSEMYNNALLHIDTSIQIRSKCTEVSPEILSKAYYTKAVILKYLNDNNAFLTALKTSIFLLKNAEIEDEYILGQRWGEMGNYYDRQNDKKKALSYYNMSAYSYNRAKA